MVGRPTRLRPQAAIKPVAPPRSSDSSSATRDSRSPPPPIVKVSVRNLRLRRGGDITYNLKMATCLMSSQEVVVSIALPESVKGISVSPTQVLFTRHNFRQSQSIAVRATEASELLRFEIQHVPRVTWSLGQEAAVAPVAVQVMPKQALFVFSFGSGLYGRLGVTHLFDKRDASANTPTPLGSKWLVPAQVACGKAHTAIIDANAHLYCFGRGSEGQLGQPHFDHVKAAAVVPKLMNMMVTQVTCGANHTMCIVSNTWVYAWGDNSCGQLGLNLKAKHHRTPSRIPHLPLIRTVVCAGNHSFAIDSGGDVFATGSNIAGQLGFGDTQSRATFTQVPHLSHVHHLVSGMYHALAHTNSPLAVLAWGCGGHGRLGLGDIESRMAPVCLEDFNGTRVLQLAAGGTHSALLTEAGDLLMWGGNAYGQVGDGLYSDRLVPHRLRMFQGKFIRAISLGEWHSVALVDDACVYAWGFGEEGQLGLGDDRSSSLPLVVNPLSGTAPVSVCCGATHTIVVTTLEATCRMQQEKDREYSETAATLERRRLTWRKSMQWKGKHPCRKRGVDFNRLHLAPPSSNKPPHQPHPTTTTTKPRPPPSRPQTARPFREAMDGCDGAEEVDHVVPWQERPLSSRTSLRTALRQEFHAIGLLQRRLWSPPPPSAHVSAAIAAKEASVKATALMEKADPFAFLDMAPRRPAPPPRKLQRPQTAPTRHRTIEAPARHQLEHTDSLSELLDDGDECDQVLAEEMQWID